LNTIIFVPGGGGSRLSLNGEEIWPPEPWEFVFNYQRIAQLQDAGVQATGIIDVYPPGALLYCYDVYRMFTGDLDSIAQQTGSGRVDFYFDWRVDISSSAHDLANEIAAAVNGGSTSITLVCHSMGNLLARRILEGGDYSSASWFDKITHYVGICGPHFGTPENLEYVLGDKGFLCITPADTKTVSANPDYPGAGYQCLPFQGYPVLFDIQNGQEDFYHSATARTLRLNLTNLQAAIDLQKKLGFEKIPNSAKYSLIAASEQLTDETIDYDGSNYHDTYQDNSGDGTIPLRSANVLQLQTQVTPGDHIGVLKTYPFRQILYNVLTAGSAAPLLALEKKLSVAAPPLTLGEKPGVALCLNKFVFLPNEPIEVLVVPDLRTDNISGMLQILAVRGRESKPFVYREQPLEYKGPPVQFIRSTLQAPADPGGYQMAVIGSHGTSPSTAAAFAVMSKSAMRRRPGKSR
jgi:hypothetical protein